MNAKDLKQGQLVRLNYGVMYGSDYAIVRDTGLDEWAGGYATIEILTDIGHERGYVQRIHGAPSLGQRIGWDVVNTDLFFEFGDFNSTASNVRAISATGRKFLTDTISANSSVDVVGAEMTKTKGYDLMEFAKRQGLIVEAA